MEAKKYLILCILGATISMFITCGGQDPIYNTANTKIPGKILVSDADVLTVSENSAGDAYSIVLSREPASDVNIRIEPDNQLTINQSSEPVNITFTPQNWSQTQIITVNAFDDRVHEEKHSGNIRHTVSSNDADFNVLTIPDITVFIDDNDTPGVVISESSGNTKVTEGVDYPDTYTITLNSQPKYNVQITVQIDGDNDDKLLINGNGTFNYLFTPINWYQARTISVTAFENAFLSQSGIIKHTVASSDTDYDNYQLNDITVTIIDNDIPGLIISRSEINISEGGDPAIYSIKLSSQPLHDVTVTAIAGSQTVVIGPNTLTFTPVNYNDMQDITILASDDIVFEGFHTDIIRHSSASDDTSYVIDPDNGIYNITVNIADNDSPHVIVTKSILSISEDGAVDTYEVSLSQMPVSAVQVIVIADIQTLLNNKESIRLIFNDSNWSVPQQVIVSAIDDNIPEGQHIGTLKQVVKTSDPAFINTTINDITVLITDND